MNQDLRVATSRALEAKAKILT